MRNFKICVYRIFYVLIFNRIYLIEKYVHTITNLIKN